VLNKALEELRRIGKVTDNLALRLKRRFGRRFDKALETVERGRVKKYEFKPSDRVVWIVVGDEGEYEVLPSVNFCSCNDFYFRVIRGEVPLCYHLIAQKLAEALNRFSVMEKKNEAYRAIMREVKV
jgi:predicted nucleic acid-binding Zn finger protein